MERILVVDDIEENRIILDAILGDLYKVTMAVDGADAFNILQTQERPTLIVSDVMMPNMNGYELVAKIKETDALRNIPVIIVTAQGEEAKALKMGAIDFINRPFNPDIVKYRVANHIELAAYRQSLESLVREKALELTSTKETFLDTMASMIEYRSLESGEHINRTKLLTGILVKRLMMQKEYRNELIACEPETLFHSAALHDVGKIGIPDTVLLKPGRLTPEEFKIIETHTVIGGEMIETMMTDKEDSYLRNCYDIAKYHHERWDGRGYPMGFSGKDIPISARIVALVDVYDALVSQRCYKASMSHEDAMAIIMQESGTHFDEGIVNAFLEVVSNVREIYDSIGDKK